MISHVRQGDIGSIFEATLQNQGAVVDLTGWTVLELIFRTPSNVKKTKTATLSGVPTAGTIRYLSVSGDLDELGEWNLQAHVTIPAGDFRSNLGNFTVDPNL